MREEARGQKQKGGADPLPSGVADVRRDLRDDLEVGEKLVAKHLLDPQEVTLHEAKDVGKDRRLKEHGSGFEGGGAKQVQGSLEWVGRVGSEKRFCLSAISLDLSEAGLIARRSSPFSATNGSW
jgi:hypothetical protein